MTNTLKDLETGKLKVQEDSETGELYLQLTPDMLSQMGWHEGDVLEWLYNGDGSYLIQKKDTDLM